MTSLSAIARLSCSVSKLLCLCAFVLAFGTSPAFAQQGSGSHPAPAPQPTEAPKQPPAFPSGENPWEQNQLIMNSGNKPALLALSSPVDCFLPPLNGLSRSTVGVADLQIPAKAQHEKEDACSALRNNKISDAESHLQKAVKQAPGYSSAWVVLGQLLEAQHKSDQASAACSHPLATDSNFMPSYLCLADISARAEQWNRSRSDSQQSCARSRSDEQSARLRLQRRRKSSPAPVARSRKERPESRRDRQSKHRPSRSFLTGANLRSKR